MEKLDEYQLKVVELQEQLTTSESLNASITKEYKRLLKEERVCDMVAVGRCTASARRRPGVSVLQERDVI